MFGFYVREGRDNLFETMVMSVQLIIATMDGARRQKTKSREDEEEEMIRFCSLRFYCFK